jgi:signal peptidase II
MANGVLPGRLAPGLVIAGLVVIVDQATKLWVDTALDLYRPVALLPIFNLTLSYNEGAAFGLLQDQGGWQRWLFTGLALAVSGYIGHWLTRLGSGMRWHAAGLSAILGGAIGNLIDRLVYGHVVDFVDIHYGEWHYPAFNVADAAITIGVVLLIIGMWREGEA